MRFLFCLLMTAVAGVASNDQPVVEVFVPFITSREIDYAFLRARVVVNEIYSGIGVRVAWKSTRSASLGCANQPYRRIVVDFRAETPADRSQNALAFSNLYSTEGPCVTLLMDRLEPMMRRNPSMTGFLLGHVLAHEMGHVLEGIAHHSETGVMKDTWSADEVMEMPMKRLRFAEFDTELILRSLAVRGRE